MITYTEVPNINQGIIDIPVVPPTYDSNGGQELYKFTALANGIYALDMTIYASCGSPFGDVTTVLTKNGIMQSSNPNYISRTTQATIQEITHSHKAQITLNIGDVVYFGGYTSVGLFDAILFNGAMIILKVG